MCEFSGYEAAFSLTEADETAIRGNKGPGRTQSVTPLKGKPSTLWQAALFTFFSAISQMPSICDSPVNSAEAILPFLAATRPPCLESSGTHNVN